MWRKQIGDRKSIMIGIRPENIKLQGGSGDCKIKIDYVENHGNELCVAFFMNDVMCMATADVSTAISNDTYLKIDWSKVHMFDKETTLNIGYPEEIKKDSVFPGIQ